MDEYSVVVNRMLTTKVKCTFSYTLEERVNALLKRKREWALDVKENDERPWTLTTWEDKPTKEQIQFAIDVMVRTAVMLR